MEKERTIPPISPPLSLPLSYPQSHESGMIWQVVMSQRSINGVCVWAACIWSCTSLTRWWDLQFKYIHIKVNKHRVPVLVHNRFKKTNLPLSTWTLESSYSCVTVRPHPSPCSNGFPNYDMNVTLKAHRIEKLPFSSFCFVSDPQD